MDNDGAFCPIAEKYVAPVAGAMSGTALRLRRLAPKGTWLMVPLDHGVSMGVVPGLERPAGMLEAAARGGATCVTLHRGLVPLAARHAGDLGVLLHLSASTMHAPDPDDKRLVASVADAVRMGCDGVSIHLNLGSATEADQLEEAGEVATECQEWGMPLVVMAYPRGPKVKDPFDPVLVAHAARLAAELGADAVKVPYTGSAATFRPVVEGCGIPVLVAGGPARADLGGLLADVRDARAAGAAGVSVGRNAFQNAQPREAIAALARVLA
ncbi:MAG: fructose-bisphosphate aldolase, class [Thermoplasmata archaeon]|jgi:class I fructose-bisphosphate aldolase|nr:fructose-bisphosphate aldolase, class [Thermoplasmata archaeon]